MTLQMIFWMVWIIGLLFGGYTNRNGLVLWLGNSLVVWALLGILGWAVFGAAIHK